MAGVEFQFHNVVEERYYSLPLTGMSQDDTKINTDGYKAVIDSVLQSLLVLNHLLINSLKVL